MWRVLLIDDEPSGLILHRIMLERGGFEVATAPHADPGLALIPTFQPHLIISDDRMSDTDGLDVCHILKNSAATRHIPLVIFTTSNSPENRKIMLEAGADDFWGKPLLHHELLRRTFFILTKFYDWLPCPPDERAAYFLPKLMNDHTRLEVRLALIELFSQQPPPHFEQSLNDLSTEPAASIRAEVARSFAQVQGEGSVSALLALLQDKEIKVRQQAIVSLGELGDERAVEALMVALEEADWDLRISAVNALGKIGSPLALNPLIDTLQDPKSTMRLTAVNALKKLQHPAVLNPLLKALFHDPDAYVRHAALNALRDFQDNTAQEAIFSAVQDESSLVRQAALKAIQYRDDDRVEALFQQALQDDSPAIRKFAEDALEHF